jgi:hypothetical protein
MKQRLEGAFQVAPKDREASGETKAKPRGERRRADDMVNKPMQVATT